MQRKFRVLSIAAGVFVLIAAAVWVVSRPVSAGVAAPPAQPPEQAAVDAAQSLSDLPLLFIANAGQTDPQVHFTVQGAGYTLFFTDQGVTFRVAARRAPDSHVQPGYNLGSGVGQPVSGSDSVVVRLEFAGADPEPAVRGVSPMPGVANFFLGNSPAAWRANVPTYGAVAYANLYPGVDLVYRGSEGHLKSEFRLAAGADPGVIRVDYHGLLGARLERDGSLVLQTELGELVEGAPLIYQEVDGVRRLIPGGYTLLQLSPSPAPLYQVGFRVSDYDPARMLVIDPVLVFSTYLGGSDSDQGTGIAVDQAGSIYVGGATYFGDFPIYALQPPNTPASSYQHAFITKIISASGVYTYGYSTYLGGTIDCEDLPKSTDEAHAIAVDAAGNAYVTGETFSRDFPLAHPLQTFGGYSDVFVTKIISASGVYTWGFSTMLGSDMNQGGYGIALDPASNIGVTGYTNSPSFPTYRALEYYPGDWYNAFVTKLISATGAYTWGYSTYLGGNSYDYGYAIAMDRDGNAYVTGSTSGSFPIYNAFKTTLGGSGDAFVTKIISASGVYTYGYSTYLGGNSADSGQGIAVDGAGNAYVTGQTYGNGYPLQDAMQPTFGGYCDAFIAKIGTKAQLGLTKSVTPTQALPGQAITFTLVYSNAGDMASGVMLVDRVPISVTQLSYTSSGAAIVPSGSFSYTWQVADLTPKAGGIITISGVLSPGLRAGLVISNVITITGKVGFDMAVTRTAQATLTVLNAAPLAHDDAVSTTDRLPVAANVLSNDSDPNADALILSAVGQPLTGTAAISDALTVLYTPVPGHVGTDAFTYTVSDGTLSANAWVTVTLTHGNAPPEAADDGAVTLQDAPVTLEVLANDSDPDGDPLLVGAVGSPLSGTVAISNAATLVYTPALGVTGDDVFTYTASDGSLDDTAVVTVAVVAGGAMAPVDATLGVTVSFTATQEGSPVTTTLEVPPGAVTGTTTLVYSELPTTTHPISGGFSFAGRVFSLDAYQGASLQPGFVFNVPVTITLSYNPEGLDGADLELRYWDETTGSWSSDGIVMLEQDTVNYRVVASIQHLTEFGVLARQPGVYVPMLIRAAR